MDNFLFPRSTTSHVSNCQKITWSNTVRHILIFFTIIENLEQWYCIQFCQKLGEIQAEIIGRIQQTFGYDTMGVTQSNRGTVILKMATCLWKVISVMEDHQQAEMLPLSRKCTH